MSFTSQIDTRLGETPKTNDPELFSDLVDVYNAIHILSQASSQIIDNLNSGDDPSAEPNDSLKFERWFWVTTNQDLSVGNIVTAFRYTAINDANNQQKTYSGLYRGAPIIGWGPKTLGTTMLYGPELTFVGVALEDVQAGQKAKIGIGPAAIKATGVNMGDYIVARRALKVTPPDIGLPGTIRARVEEVFDGGFYKIDFNSSSPVGVDDNEFMYVGHGIATDQIMIAGPATQKLRTIEP